MKTKYILIVIASFFCSLFVFILCAKFGLSRGIGPLNWQDIYENLHKFLIASFVGAIIFTFSYFASKYGNKKEK